jgi:hypothetical protein
VPNYTGGDGEPLCVVCREDAYHEGGPAQLCGAHQLTIGLNNLCIVCEEPLAGSGNLPARVCVSHLNLPPEEPCAKCLMLAQ